MVLRKLGKTRQLKALTPNWRASSLLSAFALFCAATSSLTVAHAAPSVAPEPSVAGKEALPGPSGDGLAALKAQMNALQSGLENLRRLRNFFDETKAHDQDAVLARAERLIGTLPQHENAGDAAWRIAAVATLTLQSGALTDINIDNGYRLAPGSVGWDLGPDGAQVHTGFTPITPETLGEEGAGAAVSGETALTDGITSLQKFEVSLPNGLYRVLIVRDAADEAEGFENPFGGEINVNGAPIKGALDGERDRVKLTGSDDQVASTDAPETRKTALGLGIEGWAIVEDGQLKVDFGGLPAGRAITAIIAEPLDLNNVELDPVVAETLAGALGDVAPAAGSGQGNGRSRGPRFAGAGGSGGFQGPASQNQPGARAPGSGGSRAAGGAGARRGGSAPSPTSFAASRQLSSTPNDDAEENVTPTPDEPVITPVAADDVPAFEDREVLVKRSVSEGPDSDGIAIDLGPVLDDASDSGVFMCLSEPCSDTPAIAPEPDLTAAADELGDWLGNPETLPEDWEELADVLAARGDGSEVAIVYEFDIEEGGWTDVELRASSGGGLFVWLDGEYIFGASESGAFTDDLNFEYSVLLPDLAGGKHFLQFLLEDHTGDQDFAFELRGTPVSNTNVAATSVTEPGTVALFAAGIFGLAVARRQRKLAK